MIHVMHEEHSLSDLFLKFLLERSMRIQADLVDQLFNSSEKRLARILLLMAEFGKPGEPEQYIPKISQETLAEMIGTTRSRVSFFMNRFRKLGFIEYNGRIKVHKSLLNAVLLDQLPERNPRDLSKVRSVHEAASKHGFSRAVKEPKMSRALASEGCSLVGYAGTASWIDGSRWRDSGVRLLLEMPPLPGLNLHRIDLSWLPYVSCRTSPGGEGPWPAFTNRAERSKYSV
jgi:hypothetical protein